jgi:ABC-type transporter Mla subunit MlaD
VIGGVWATPRLDTAPHPAHDHCVESQSLPETIIGLPGALLRLPSSALAALEAINETAERLDRLMAMLDRMEGGVNRAGTGIDIAALGISRAVSGLELAVGTLDSSLPSLSDSASALRTLTERLSCVAVELANELPKATKSLQEVSPELASVVGLLDDRFAHLDVVVSELARLMEAVVGTIPGMRRVLRVTSSTTPFEPT